MNTGKNRPPTNPYEVLGLPTPGFGVAAPTSEAAKSAYMVARLAAGSDYQRKSAVTDAYRRVVTDLNVIASGGRSAYVAAPVADVPAVTAVIPVLVGASAAGSESFSSSASGAAGGWGPTVTGEVYDAGAGVPLGEPMPNPYEVRSTPAFASAEFVQWETEFNQVELERAMHPKGKMSLVAVFFCIVFGILGVVGGFWGSMVSLGMYGLAVSEAGMEAAAANPQSISPDAYFQGAMFFALMVLVSLGLFFVPFILRGRRARKMNERYRSLLSYGTQNGWLAR